MKKTFLLIFLFITTLFYGQSKIETENWLEEKYNEYERSINSNMNLWIDEGYLYYYFTLYDDPVKAKENGVLYRMKIQDIKSIKIIKKKFNSEDKIGWSYLTLYTNSNKIFSKDFPENNNFTCTNEGFLNIPLKAEFIDEGVNIRFQKAIIHLVKLYGGNATVKKEAF